MTRRQDVDAVVVGSGPNGLAAAWTLARAGRSVVVVEGAETAGGGCRTLEVLLPGHRHDVCATVLPLLAASPFAATSGLLADGTVELLTPEVSFAHALGADRAVAVHRSLEATVDGLGRDGPAYRRLVAALVARADTLVGDVLSSHRSWPSDPVALAAFGRLAVQSATSLARRFDQDGGPAVLAGLAAHAGRPLNAPLTGGLALFLAVLAHHVGWPLAAGGTSTVTSALLTRLADLGVEVETGTTIRSLDDLDAWGPPRWVFLDVTPRQFADLAGSRLRPRQRRAYAHYRYGPGVHKVDWVLSGPVPWLSQVCRAAPTVHLGGDFRSVARTLSEVAAGRHPVRPSCIVVQPSVIDPSRAPAGRHVLWATCPVPHGSTCDVTDRVEDELEQVAPGFRDLVVARASTTAAASETSNPNHVGGDINGGAATLGHALVGPRPRFDPYRTPLPGVWLCSSSVPPGGGAHGMSGWLAAQSALGAQAARASKNGRSARRGTSERNILP
ncbi:MAG: NAD(P)/FAD-dependent oxidoreductase [Actinomycetota bacterium]|nr:NAD(P)/FAD-dependent oxidoreductase [Actinomycetota bacterium]MDA8293386.1 NAD(P)/FAD-dependent oxidoreductase [Actinomycetota bacterium]